MKKTVLGKITFVMLCVVTIMFIATKSYIAWYMGDGFGGWKVMFEFADILGGYAKFNIITEFLLMPIMWSILCIAYVIYVGKDKRINRILYAGTALAILADTIIYIIELKFHDYIQLGFSSISLIPLYIRIGFLLAVIILCIGINKIGFNIALGALFCVSVMGTLVYMIIRCIRNMSVLMEEASGFEDMADVFIFAEYFVIPILGFVVGVLLIGYILFPTKYIKDK